MFAARHDFIDSLQKYYKGLDLAMCLRRRVSNLVALACFCTFCPASKLIPKAADMPSTAAGDTPAVMHAALQPSFTTKALA